MSFFPTVPSKYHGTEWEDQYPNVPNNIPSTVFFGGLALPTLTGDGVIVQNTRRFYQLNCDESSCNWKMLEKTLPYQIFKGVAMILPAEYTCE